MSCATHQNRAARNTRAFTRGVLIGIATLLLSGATPAFAQQAHVQVARGPHYVGEPIDVHIIAEGYEQKPTPDVLVPTLPQGSGALQYVGVTPKVSSSISFVNGQVTRAHEVTFTYRYRYLARQPGAIHIPSFSVAQGNVSRTTSAIDLDVRQVPTSNAIDVSVGIPEGPIFIGQKVPIFVEFWIDREVQRNLVSYALDVPLLSSSNLRFIDDTGGGHDSELQIQTKSGTMLLPATSSQRARNGRTYLVIRAERTMVPITKGKLTIGAASVVIDHGTRFRRDMFRQRQATAVRKLKAQTNEIELEIAEVPFEGRPPSFAGAIGRGYTLDVTADRSVVLLGEPIALTFTLRGDGDLSSARLPRLTGTDLFDPTQFRLPEDDIAGLLGDTAQGETGKRFDVTVRVLDSAVREIPALAYSWFDTDSRKFETTYSRPIALSVGAAQVIGAGQVERRPGSEVASAENSQQDVRDDLVQKDIPTSDRASSLALTGANLAVERDSEILLRDARTGGANAVATGSLYGLGLALVGLAIADRRRRSIDPETAALQRSLAKATRELESVLSQPASQAAEAASRALRQMLSLAPDAAGAELDAILGELDARSYAPPTLDESPLPESLCEEARRTAASIVEANG
ncbi:MAG: BatD family protein [Myxococcota bacterium]|nr:BatD family protein [Myxococcota bacterium]